MKKMRVVAGMCVASIAAVVMYRRLRDYVIQKRRDRFEDGLESGWFDNDPEDEDWFEDESEDKERKGVQYSCDSCDCRPYCHCRSGDCDYEHDHDHVEAPDHDESEEALEFQEW